jgi:hypothetical protein
MSTSTKGVPGPGEYKTVPKWGCVEKKFSVTKKNTYIDQIVKKEIDKLLSVSNKQKISGNKNSRRREIFILRF